MTEQIKTFEEAVNLIAKMISATEADEERIISATMTIANLIERGYPNVALEVLATYEPGKYEKKEETK